MVKGASLSHLTLLITCYLCVTTRGLHAVPRNSALNHSGIFAEITRNYAQYPRNFADLSCREDCATTPQSSYVATSNFIQHALPVLFYFMKGCEISIDSYSSQIQSAAHTDGLDSCITLLPHKGSPIITKSFFAQFFFIWRLQN